MKQKIKELWKKIKDKGFVIKLSLIPFACGLMYAVGGSNNVPKQVRRFGIPTLLTIASWFFLKNIWVLTMLTQIFVYHIGHGIPDDNYPEDINADEGSSLGHFWTMLFRKYFDRVTAHQMADLWTRGCKAWLIAISCLAVPILKESWSVYVVASMLMVGLIASLAWRGLGEKIIKIANKTYTVLYVDIVVGTIIGFYVLIILKF